jgi:uncharacterized GH25 family protein
MKLPLLLIGLALAHAQQPNAAISGTVRDAATGKPLAGFNVSTDVNATWMNDTIFQTADTRQVHAVTDENGRYLLSDLPPATYRLQTRGADFGSSRERRVTLAGRELDNMDFRVKVDGTISGRVLDENKEPVPGITVYLISREYYYGILGYFIKGSGLANDRGEYTIQRVEAGHPYFVMAETLPRRMPAHSEVPLSPKLRRRAAIRTFYPNSPNKEGGAPITVRPGEHRENADIELRKSQNYCVEGTVTGPTGPAAFRFGVETQPSSGMSSTGGLYSLPPGGATGPDGKFRVCDLTPGVYRFTAWQTAGQKLGDHAMLPFTIGDRDIANFNVALSAGPTLNGEVLLDGPAPAEPLTTKINVSLGALLRSGLQGENFYVRSSTPGTFSFTGLVLGDYGVRATANSPGFYVKSIDYAGNDLRYEPLHMGSAMEGVPLRVIIARDGATLSVIAADKDNQPAADMQVLIMPKEIAAEAVLQAALIRGATDQNGRFQSHSLRPGKYYVAATDESFDPTPESISRLWRASNRFTEVELSPNGTAQITLQPITID